MTKFSKSYKLLYLSKENKMKIANFREYTSVLRELYTGEAFAETGNYYYTLMASGKKLNLTKADLQNKIKVLNQQLQLQAQKIRECTDKKRAGLEMNKLKQNKQTLVKELKALQSADHFNMLSEDAKICVCSGFLFQKYLTGEIIQNNPLHFPTNDNGDMIVNPEQLRHSELYEQALHIKDFVAAYIARYPEKVKTAGHFKTLLNDIDNWQDLLAFVNDNFDKLNDTTELLPDNVKNSRKDTEVVLTFPKQNLLLVKLKSAAALDYETAKMEHCVGKGGYDKQVANGQTEIYSLRSIEPDGEWLPHGTIEFYEGKIAQIKGFQNKKIEEPFVSAIRKSILHLCQNNNIDELFQQKRCSDLKNCGYIITADNILVDLYNHPQEDIHLTYFDSNSDLLKFLSPKQLIIDRYNFQEDISEESIASLKKFKSIKQISIKKPERIKDVLSVRNLFYDSLQTQDLSTHIDEKSLNYLGFSQKWYPEKPITINITTPENALQFQKEYPSVLIDILKTKKTEYIQSISTQNPSFPLIKQELITVQSASIEGITTAQTIAQINKLAGVQILNIDNADFSKIKELDLRNLKFFTPDYIPQGSDLLWVKSAIFLEGFCIPQMVNDHVIIIKDCTDTPQAENIKLPQDIKHFMLALPEKEKFRLPDFRIYPELESLQINNLDLSDNKVIYLPQGIKYLAFYDCKFGAHPHMDLTGFKRLKELRLNRCDLSQIEKISLPQGVKELAIENAIFNKNCPIPTIPKPKNKFNCGQAIMEI